MTNREIKFRAWDKERGGMKYDVTVGNVGGETAQIYLNWGAITPNYPEFEGFNKNSTLMQFTGLKDCHGKEIYEGDILEIWTGDQNSIKFEIIYSEEFGAFVDKGSLNGTEDCEFEKCEIIGNIYENPELLK